MLMLFFTNLVVVVGSVVGLYVKIERRLTRLETKIEYLCNPHSHEDA